MAIRKILMTGSNGLLGYDLNQYLSAKNYDVIAPGSQALNVLQPLDELRRNILLMEPELIIHSAAYTDVDGAEKDPDAAMAINKDGTRKLAQIASELNCPFAYVSTDYVFDGTKGALYTVDDKPNPISQYGMSKYYGELMVRELLDTYYILRTSWLYGTRRHNFAQFILESLKQGRELRIVDDWTGSPTWTGSLNHTIEKVVTSGAYGIYHTVDDCSVSKYGHAKAIAKAAGLSDANIQPASYRDFSFMAKRPTFSALDPGELSVPSLETSLQGYLQEYLHQGKFQLQ